MIHQGQFFYITSHRLYDSQSFPRLNKKVYVHFSEV
jgi:hypothetical protein